MKDKDEFCKYIKQYEKSMYSLAYSIVRNEHDACDIIGEAILRAFCNLSSLKNDRSFKPWILRIVHNTAVEFIRKNSNIVCVDELSEEIEADAGDITVKITVKKAVESLKQPYRTVVVLFYYENLSVAKIAQITDTSIVAVRQQLSRARKQLREILKEDFNG